MDFRFGMKPTQVVRPVTTSTEDTQRKEYIPNDMDLKRKIHQVDIDVDADILNITRISMDNDKLISEAEAGNVTAQVRLAAKYMSGEEIPKDEKKASKWYQKATHQNKHVKYVVGRKDENSIVQPPKQEKLKEILGKPFQYVQNMEEELICQIDFEPFDDPVATPCMHTFCSKCITEWVNANGNCPTCRKDVQEHQLKGNITVAKIAEKILVQCALKASGCDWTGSRSSLESHLTEQCKFLPIDCIYCDKEISRNENHQDVCESRITLCVCEEMIYFRERDHHLKTECKKRKINCSTCKQKMRFCELEKHTPICPMGKTQCPLSPCRLEIERKDVYPHAMQHIVYLNQTTEKHTKTLINWTNGFPK